MFPLPFPILAFPIPSFPITLPFRCRKMFGNPGVRSETSLDYKSKNQFIIVILLSYRIVIALSCTKECWKTPSLLRCEFHQRAQALRVHLLGELIGLVIAQRRQLDGPLPGLLALQTPVGTVEVAGDHLSCGAKATAPRPCSWRGLPPPTLGLSRRQDDSKAARLFRLSARVDATPPET